MEITDHVHNIDPAEGVPYCEFLAIVKRSLEERLETLELYEMQRLKLLEMIDKLSSEYGPIVIDSSMTDADVRRAVARKWQHSDGSPLTPEEDAEREIELADALSDLRYCHTIDGLVMDLTENVKRARLRHERWRRDFNRAVRLQAKHQADNGGVREANKASRRSRGRGRKRG